MSVAVDNNFFTIKPNEVSDESLYNLNFNIIIKQRSWVICLQICVQFFFLFYYLKFVENDN